MKVNRAGFTIIEIMIAIAIGGLIVVSIFVAVGQLNRDKRDDARKADAARLLSATRQWVSANNGILPVSTDVGNIISSNITSAGSSFAPPGLSAWSPLFVSASQSLPLAPGTIYISAPANCSNNLIVPIANNTSRQVAVSVYQESNGGSYCIAQ